MVDACWGMSGVWTRACAAGLHGVLVAAQRHGPPPVRCGGSEPRGRGPRGPSGGVVAVAGSCACAAVASGVRSHARSRAVVSCVKLDQNFGVAYTHNIRDANRSNPHARYARGLEPSRPECAHRWADRTGGDADVCHAPALSGRPLAAAPAARPLARTALGWRPPGRRLMGPPRRSFARRRHAYRLPHTIRKPRRTMRSQIGWRPAAARSSP